MAGFTRKCASLGAVAENREVEDVSVSVRKHSKQVTVVVWLLGVRRVQYSVVFESQIAKTKVNPDQWHHSQVSSLDQTHN